MKIDGHTNFIAIFGWPLAYTRSPLFQNAGLERARVNAAYLPIPVQAAEFPALWKSMSRLPNFLGANVTNPHKLAALKLADRLTPEARAIGAVNTLYRSGKAWVGHNTDAQGFLKAFPISPRGRRGVVFGAGGTARAIVFALLKAGVARVELACRRPAQGKSLLKALRAPKALLSVRALGREPIAQILAGAEFAVNTVPGADFAARLGRAKSSMGSLRAAFDASYAQTNNPFLKAAPRGAKRVDGSAMLLEQGCLSFERWTGKRAPKAAMKRALGH